MSKKKKKKKDSKKVKKEHVNASNNLSIAERIATTEALLSILAILLGAAFYFINSNHNIDKRMSILEERMKTHTFYIEDEEVFYEKRDSLNCVKLQIMSDSLINEIEIRCK